METSAPNDGDENTLTLLINNVPIRISTQGQLGQVMQGIRPTLERQLLAEMDGRSGDTQAPVNPRLAYTSHSQAGHGHSHRHSDTQQTSMAAPSRGRGHQHTHSHSHSHAQPTQDSGASATQPSSFIIDFGDGAEQNVDVNQNSEATGGDPEGPAGLQAAAQTVQNLPSVKSVMRTLKCAVPFIILFFAKIMYNHRLGILVFGAMFGTFFHANSSLQKHISQREQGRWLESCGQLAWIITFLSVNIFCVYWVFEEQELFRSLYLGLPLIEHIDVWHLLWIVGITDFILKFATIIIKSLLAMLPKLLLPYKKKGKYYMLIEKLSQLYRSVVPITPWVCFILDDEHGGEWFSIILLIVYTVFKGLHLWQNLKELKITCTKFQVDVSYGTIPDRSKLELGDNSCPICQDKYTDPIMLTSCEHIFCEDCVSMWFDRERTCPMCRANIVDNPKWRDGTTSSNLQLY